jgi:phosphinothricin acetyltransferase
VSDARIRPAIADDHAAITDLYNHYVVRTPITFDVEPYALQARRPWFEQFADGGRYRLLVAEGAEGILGYACTLRYRPKAAYETSVETSVYLRPDATGQGLGALLYGALFAALRGEDVHRALAGITLPNPASVALHRRFGFRSVGVYSHVGRKFGRYWDVEWFEKELDRSRGG